MLVLGGVASLKKSVSAKRVAFTGILAALAIVLSFLESLIPPIPFMPPGTKLGLSNIVTMYAAGTVGLPYAIFIAILKSGFAFMTRGVMAGVMSLCGGIVSTFVMWLILKKTSASLTVIGVCGALSHNLAQLAVAWFLMRAAVFYYAPFMLILGVITGILTGIILKLSLPPLERVSRLIGAETTDGTQRGTR